MENTAKTRKNNPLLSLCFYIGGFCLSVIPPVVCALSYFPLWKSIGYEYCIAGSGALVLAICLIPIIRLVRNAISGYSAYLIWLMLFLIFFSLSKIADQMTVISLVGFVGNLLGAVCFALARRFGGKKEE